MCTDYEVFGRMTPDNPNTPISSGIPFSFTTTAK